MPIYCYRHASGQLAEVAMSADEMLARQDEDGYLELDSGERVRRDYSAEHV